MGRRSAKLLGMYGSVLKQAGEWRLLAAIIVRLRKRVAEDLPVDGAVVDDLVEAYARCWQDLVISSMERGIVTDAAAFEALFQTTWRLSHTARRVRITVIREDQGEAWEERLVQSGRPRCLVLMRSALLELPIGEHRADVCDVSKAEFTKCVKASAAWWAPDEKCSKMLGRLLMDLS